MLSSLKQFGTAIALNAMKLSPSHRLVLKQYLRHKCNVSGDTTTKNNNNDAKETRHSDDTRAEHATADSIYSFDEFTSYIFDDIPLIPYAMTAALLGNYSLTQQNRKAVQYQLRRHGSFLVN